MSILGILIAVVTKITSKEKRNVKDNVNWQIPTWGFNASWIAGVSTSNTCNALITDCAAELVWSSGSKKLLSMIIIII